MNKLSIIIVFVCLGCNPYNKENDELVFIDSTKNVSKAIVRMKILMDKLPDNEITNYFITDENLLYINNNKCCYFDEAILSNKQSGIKELAALTPQEYDEFFKLILFLNRNNIASVIKTSYYQKYLFEYNKFGYTLFERQRRIIHLDDYDKNIEKHYFIKDSVENLLLLGPRNMEDIEN